MTTARAMAEAESRGLPELGGCGAGTLSSRLLQPPSEDRPERPADLSVEPPLTGDRSRRRRPRHILPPGWREGWRVWVMPVRVALISSRQ